MGAYLSNLKKKNISFNVGHMTSGKGDSVTRTNIYTYKCYHNTAQCTC